ncbi:MAG: 4Fe-4S dicluster domain-containing protein [Deferribacteraceae bacterium]|jgi:ferredoxin like protein|nr:4Fe-4S dicluster domain-containing protein [Deferribacteraceae bacterium]
MSKFTTVEEKLSNNTYNADRDFVHIELNPKAKLVDIMVLVCACPAGLYKYDEVTDKLNFDHTGCLECGSCRILSEGKVVKKWCFPNGGKGSEYKLG